MTKLKQEKLQNKIKELEDTINVSIVNNKLMIVISSYRSSIYLSPELFKDDKIEDIVRKIREDNLENKYEKVLINQ